MTPGALALLWEAAGLAPRDADVQNRLGEALERMGALDAAVDAYRRGGGRASRTSGRPSNNLILALVKAGKGPEAVERARALVAAAPDDPDRRFTLGLAQSEQNVNDAVASFRRVLELAPRHALARYNLALVLRRADRLPEALDELHRTLAIEPRPEAHYTLGVIYWHQGELDRAADALRAAIAAEPRYADAHDTLGAVLRARRDWAGAAASLRRAIALRPDLAGAHYTLGQVLQVSRRRDRGAARISPRRNGSAGGRSWSRKPACGRPSGPGSSRPGTWPARSTSSGVRRRSSRPTRRRTTRWAGCSSAWGGPTPPGLPSTGRGS